MDANRSIAVHAEGNTFENTSHSCSIMLSFLQLSPGRSSRWIRVRFPAVHWHPQSLVKPQQVQNKANTSYYVLCFFGILLWMLQMISNGPFTKFGFQHLLEDSTSRSRLYSHLCTRTRLVFLIVELLLTKETNQQNVPPFLAFLYPWCSNAGCFRSLRSLRIGPAPQSAWSHGVKPCLFQRKEKFTKSFDANLCKWFKWCM